MKKTQSFRTKACRSLAGALCVLMVTIQTAALAACQKKESVFSPGIPGNQGGSGAGTASSFEGTLLSYSDMLPTSENTGKKAKFYKDLAEFGNRQGDNGGEGGAVSASVYGSVWLMPNSDKIIVNGEEITLDQPVETDGGEFMIPLDLVGRYLGIEVNKNGTDFSISARNSAAEALGTYGSFDLSLNKSMTDSLRVAAAPYEKNSTTYVPASMLAAAFDLDLTVTDDGVRLYDPYETARLILWGTAELDVDSLTPAPENYLFNGKDTWYLQYRSSAETKTAHRELTKAGYRVDTDRLAFANDYTAEEYKTWGGDDCGFDSFFADFADRMTETAVVAVIDSGTDTEHELLRDRLLPGYDFVDGDDTPVGKDDHGTHVAGTIADLTKGAPVYILPIRVFDDEGNGNCANAGNAVEYAADHGADVINMSLGASRTDETQMTYIEEKIRYAVKKGCLVVLSAGNDGKNTMYQDPAFLNIPGVIVVSAGDQNHRITDFSNYGDNIKVLAPGYQIVSAVFNGEYGSKNGTSMAAPHVAAVAALVKTVVGDSISVEELDKIVQSATEYGEWKNYQEGCGFLNLRNITIPEKGNDPKADPPQPAPVNSYNLALFNDPDNSSVFGSLYTRERILSVKFQNSRKGAPVGAWDVSAEKNGTVVAWCEKNGGDYDLIIAADGTIKAPESCMSLFADYTAVERIDFGGIFDTSGTRSMHAMFENCSNLKSIAMTGIDTSSAADMTYMFSGCTSLTEVDCSRFDTGNVTQMLGMFMKCSSLPYVDVSGFDTSNVTDMRWMFHGCVSLNGLDVSHFNTSRLTDVERMFSWCAKVEKLDVSGFDTSQVTDMHAMFTECASLTSLDISGFDTSLVEDVRWMFKGCANLKSLDLSVFDLNRIEQLEGFLDGVDLGTETPVVEVINIEATGHFEGYGPENLFDGNPETKWCTPFDKELEAVTWEYTVPVCPGKVILTTGSDNSINPGRNAGSYSLFCSADGDNWFNLVHSEHSEFWDVDDQDMLEVTLPFYGFEDGEGNRVYPEFRYFLLGIESTTGSDIVQLSEIRIIPEVHD